MGWCFAMRVWPVIGINSIEDWLPLLCQNNIVDENHVEVGLEQMMRIIADRAHLVKGNAAWIAGPGSRNIEVGPHGLLRPVEDEHVRHSSSGPWYYVSHYFH